MRVFLPPLFQFFISASCSTLLSNRECSAGKLRILWKSGPGPRRINSELGNACVFICLEWLLLVKVWQIPKAGGSMGVSALVLTVFSRPLMLRCSYFLHVLSVLSAHTYTHTHTHSLLHTCPLFPSQFDSSEWTTSRLWDDLLPVAAPLLKQASHIAEGSGRWVGRWVMRSLRRL